MRTVEPLPTVGLQVAAELLNFGARLGSDAESHHRAEQQLRGAVAIHHRLAEQGVAYLADEVGMGKTRVALGALALFKHFHPGFRALIIAPRKNIQENWINERRNFVEHNVRFADLRNRAPDGRPATPVELCENLIDLVRLSNDSPQADIVARMPSFSRGLSEDTAQWRELWSALKQQLPWLEKREDLFDQRSKETFRQNFARAVCCGLPVFDLVIVDEAHNLKRGTSFVRDRQALLAKSRKVASRNEVMALAFGHPLGAVSQRQFPGYGVRARRVLFLSATPVESDYRQLWHQLDVFGLADAHEDFALLHNTEAPESERKAVARKLVVRRVTTLKAGDAELTKNQYRREWREGGVEQHDEPIHFTDARQRLVVALVQKKVSEVLAVERAGADGARFSNAFQMGMLASFESFGDTARVQTAKDETRSAFDDADQTDEEVEKQGIDTDAIRHLLRSHRRTFEGREMPHPKMDELVRVLKQSWRTGEKALVFVRRISSVTELKRKLDDEYDAWLRERLESALPDSAATLARHWQKYREERDAVRAKSKDTDLLGEESRASADRGGCDTFFAWFFRGEGPRDVFSGANFSARLADRSGGYATVFSVHHLADWWQCEPSQVLAKLSVALRLAERGLLDELAQRAASYIGQVKRAQRGDVFLAVQAAAFEWLKEEGDVTLRDAAQIRWQTFYSALKEAVPTSAELDANAVRRALEQRTFFTELAMKTELAAELWPRAKDDDERAFLERELRAQLIAATCRRGHALIDLWLLAVQLRGGLGLGGQQDDGLDEPLIAGFLERLARGRVDGEWSALDELRSCAEHHALIRDVNLPEEATRQPEKMRAALAQLLREQAPVAGMHTRLNKTVVHQFRMPGYPLVLITTELLKEGENLHTFCAAVHHYGIAWTPSAMEQRTGRIDRVQSLAERRLRSVSEAHEQEKLQVHYPHLQGTVEVLQVRRVLRRMNTFLRLMHEGLHTKVEGSSRIETDREMLRCDEPVERITSRLETSFDVVAQDLKGQRRGLARTASDADQLRRRFETLRELTLELPGLKWDEHRAEGRMFGTVWMVHPEAPGRSRQQPFALYLKALGEHPLVRCISPVGRAELTDDVLATLPPARLVVVPDDDGLSRSYTLSVEEDVMLADARHDGARLRWLISRVTRHADDIEYALLQGADKSLTHFRDDLAQV